MKEMSSKAFFFTIYEELRSNKSYRVEEEVDNRNKEDEDKAPAEDLQLGDLVIALVLEHVDQRVAYKVDHLDEGQGGQVVLPVQREMVVQLLSKLLCHFV